MVASCSPYLMHCCFFFFYQVCSSSLDKKEGWIWHVFYLIATIQQNTFFLLSGLVYMVTLLLCRDSGIVFELP